MGSMTNDDYTSIFLEFLSYVPYLREEKAKVQRFINRFPVAYRDRIEFNEPRSFDEAIQKLKHFYEHSKCKVDRKHELKTNEKDKVKWTPKRGRHQGASEKGNVVPYKRFNKAKKARGDH